MTMLVLGNVIYAGSNGALFAFDIETGSPVWSNNLSGRGYGPVTLMYSSSSQGRPTLYVGLNGSITAFDTNSRAEISHIKLPATQHTYVALTIHNGDIWASSGSELFKLDSHTLALRVSNPLKGSGYGVGGSLILLSVNGHEIAIEGHNGYAIGVDLKTGSVLWKSTVSSMGKISTFLEHKGVVYVSCCGSLHAIDPVSGKLLWTNELKGLGYCNAGLATVFKTTNCHADQPFVAEHEIATSKRH